MCSVGQKKNNYCNSRPCALRTLNFSLINFPQPICHTLHFVFFLLCVRTTHLVWRPTISRTLRICLDFLSLTSHYRCESIDPYPSIMMTESSEGPRFNPQWSLVEGTQGSISLIDNILCISSKRLRWEIIYKEMSFFLQQLESICGFVRPHGVWNTSLSYILWSISKSLCHYTPHPPFLNPALQISI